MQSSMSAAQLVAPRRIEMVATPRPDPAPGQVRVALEGCGVCASNLPAWNGRPWFDYPMPAGSLGHEGWGTVDALGAGVAAGLLGQRVALVSERAYAEYDVAPVAAVVPLPDGVPALAPLEPFACVFNVLARCDIAPGQAVAVVGLGFIGLALTRLLRAAGAEVLALSRSADALAKAAALGARTCCLETPEPAAVPADLSGALPRVVECTGYQAPLDLASQLVAPGGRLVIAGYHQDGPRQVDLQQWNWKGIDVSNAHERDPARIRSGMAAAAAALAAEPAWVDELITHRFVLDRLDAALAQAEERPRGFTKAAVLMAGGAAA
jgi:threonine dehydrogenase-like Zn-dependent dehydrogenase